MSDFDPDRFEDKYEHYFTELQQAYRQAFEAVSERHDSDLVHAIDQRILSESEPFYEGGSEQRSADESSGQGPREHHGEFRIKVPDDAVERLPDRDPERVERVLEDYRSEIAAQLRDVFDLA
ncbi:DUF5783 family protein [Halorhabdus amylolytica]|uniref:DUF5783 family protein n=1 Tax=Halorhabdus amylolytica TaxID=2559573 RepID=UPI0010AAB228|nr:DUF5783 family protein [Halorhabdus amylolytica]